MRTTRGFTLLELLVVLGLTAVLLALAFPGAARWRDAAATRAARDELASALARTRVAAVAHGGASLWVDPGAAAFWTSTAAGLVETPVDLGERYGVSVDPGAAAAVEIRFDGLGLGRLSNRTVVVRRGGAERGVTVSAYGRVRRW